MESLNTTKIKEKYYKKHRKISILCFVLFVIFLILSIVCLIVTNNCIVGYILAVIGAICLGCGRVNAENAKLYKGHAIKRWSYKKSVIIAIINYMASAMYFLCFNALYEQSGNITSNSLHMLFPCIALFIAGFFASIRAQDAKCEEKYGDDDLYKEGA